MLCLFSSCHILKWSLDICNIAHVLFLRAVKDKALLILSEPLCAWYAVMKQAFICLGSWMYQVSIETDRWCQLASMCCWALCHMLQINGSLARAAIKELAGAGLIRPVSTHSKQIIYTRATNVWWALVTIYHSISCIIFLSCRSPFFLPSIPDAIFNRPHCTQVPGLILAFLSIGSPLLYDAWKTRTIHPPIVNQAERRHAHQRHALLPLCPSMQF